jgi:tRNA threonylcarbamoyladenosine biosynthesis protein TsaE
MKALLSVNLNGIKPLAKEIAKALKGGEIFALVGTLGAGKTTFVKALAKELKVKHKITSPTFTLMHNFEAKIPSSKKKVFIYHLDLYRTKNFKEVKALGITETWGRPETVTVIEWADKIKKYLPAQTKTIKFENNEQK